MKIHKLDVEQLKVESFSTSKSSVTERVALLPAATEASCHFYCTIAGECGSFFICE